MGRFSRRRDGQNWVRALPDPFSLDDVLALVGSDEVEPALSWLYDCVEHGRIEPVQGRPRMLYHFVGERRSDDGAAAADRPARLSSRVGRAEDSG
jgi:hypothetical protein